MPEIKPARGKLSKLLAEDMSGDNLFFPNDLPTMGHYVAFRISKDIKFKRAEVSRSDTQLIIMLPMPANLATSYNAQYSAEAVGALGGFGAEQGANARKMVDGQMSGQQFAASLVDSFSADANKAKVGGGLMNIGAQAAETEVAALAGAALGGVGGAAAGAAASGAFKAGMAAAGAARNPHMATLFTGVDFRSHSFEYKFIPKSKQESDILADIIYRLKYHMAPSYAAEGHFFNYPEQFDIEFANKKYLFDIGASVLSAFNVSYSGEGSSYFFNNEGAPVSVSLSMTFQELTINTKENISREGSDYGSSR